MGKRQRALKAKAPGQTFSLCMAIPAMLVLLALFALPAAANLGAAFTADDGSFTLERIRATVSAPYTWRLLGFTVLQAALSSVFSVLAALPGAYLYANYRFRGKRMMLTLASLCFVLPSILVVLGFVIFYGNSGAVNWLISKITGGETVKFLYSFRAIIMAHVFLNAPIVLTLVTDAWAHTPRSAENAAKLLGASPSRVFLTVTLPRIAPSILSASLLVFLFCFTSFSIILVLGGGPAYTTLEVEIYRLNNIAMDQAGAASLSVFSLMANTIVLIAHTLASRSFAGREKSRDDRAVTPSSRKTKVAIALYNLAALVFILGPLLSIPVRSLRSTSKRYGEGFSLRAYAELFGLERGMGAMADAGAALANSLCIALAVAALATVMALFLSLSIAKSGRKWPEIAAMLPMAVSSVTLGLGYNIIKSRVGSTGMAAAYALVLCAHLVMALPFAMRTILPQAKAANPRVAMASATLGAGGAKTVLMVEAPSLKYACARAFMFSFALSMGEVNATMTLAEGKVATLPILLYRLINSYNYQGACAIGTLLALATLVVFAIGENAGRRNAEQ